MLSSSSIGKECAVSPTFTISLDVPDGTEITIAGVEDGTIIAGPPSRDPVEEYWHDYLSHNGRKVFETAARIEDVRGPGYTFDDLAQALSIDYESVKSYHRNAGRTAGRWERDKGMPPPVRLEFNGEYAPESSGAWRTHYKLAPGVADTILALV
jgi:hypothetical protein